MIVRNFFVCLLLVVSIFCYSDANALNSKEKLLVLLDKLSEKRTSYVVSDKSTKKHKKSPKSIIGKILKEIIPQQSHCEICKMEVAGLWYQHDIDCQEDVSSKIGENYYRELMENLMIDVERISTDIDYNALIEIIPSFLLYFIHNASMFPPLGEGYIQAREASLPLGYFRDRPASSPIMGIYSTILDAKIINKIKQLYGFDSKSFLLQPLNIRMFEFLKVLTSEDETISLDKIKIFDIAEENIFLIEEEERQRDVWQDTFSLIVASGLPQNTFEAISSGVRIFLKHYDDSQFVYNDDGDKCIANIENKILALVNEIGPSFQHDCVTDLYDETIIYRAEICDKIIDLIRDHKFKHIKPFHVTDSQNLIIEILAPPYAGKVEYNVSSVEHGGWVNLINGFFGGLLNHYANQNKQYIYTTIRDSYGFLRPTLTPCGTAIRLSMGLQPSCYADIVAGALIALDEILDGFGCVYIDTDKDDNSIIIKAKGDVCGKEFFVDISKTNSEENVRSIISILQNKASFNFAQFLLERIKNGYSHENNYYLNSMISGFDKKEPMFSPDSIIISSPVAQYLLEDSKQKTVAISLGRNYLLESFIRYLNEMILSRINVVHNEIRLEKIGFLEETKTRPVYYLRGFGGSIKEEALGQDGVIHEVLSNIQM